MKFTVRGDSRSAQRIALYLVEADESVALWGETEGGLACLIGRFCDLGFYRSKGFGATCIPVDESGCIKVV